MQGVELKGFGVLGGFKEGSGCRAFRRAEVCEAIEKRLSQESFSINEGSIFERLLAQLCAELAGSLEHHILDPKHNTTKTLSPKP